MFKRKVQGRIASGAALPALVLALIGASIATPAQARHHHHGRHALHHPHFRSHARHGGRHVHAAVGGGATAAIVEDGATGRVLWSMNAEAPRHPASITKVMTLYLLFEQLEKGRLTLDSEIPISRHAASMAPSKLNLHPGDEIRAEDAIKAIVTKSANDIAVAVAEKLGGSESEFAEMMTRKARELGMNHTVYVNASGLPNNAQITTAGDLAVLGRDIQARFPRYYHYFSLREVNYRGMHLRNHNHLLGRIEGMDGIKTGYTAASGFNLMTSVKRDGHYIVSVVLGGSTARARDNYMEALIDDHLEEGGAPRFARQEEQAPARVEAAKSESSKSEAARAEARKAERSGGESARADDEAPQLPIAAVIPEARPRPAYVSAAAQASRENDDTRLPTASISRETADGSTSRLSHVRGSAATPAMRWSAGPSAVVAYRSTTHFVLSPSERAKAEQAKREEAATERPRQVAEEKPPVSGWMIQIGATDAADKAAALLSRAKNQRHAYLGSARPFTEMVRKGRGTIYRARFAGLEEDKAQAACKALKSSGFSCFATRD